MSAADPTWRLVLAAARDLHRRNGTFRLGELIAEVQRADSSRGATTIAPVVQGMTVNAGTGPASPCGKPLRRITHGLYEYLADEAPAVEAGVAATIGGVPSPTRKPSWMPGLHLPAEDLKRYVASYLAGRSPNARYASFDYCYGHFQSARDAGDLDRLVNGDGLQLSCLQLGALEAEHPIDREAVAALAADVEAQVHELRAAVS